MNELLFDIPESKSPRLQWMERHGVKVTDGGMDFEEGDECMVTGAQLYRFYAHRRLVSGSMVSIRGGGHTEEAALVKLAKSAGLRLWNEEEISQG